MRKINSIVIFLSISFFSCMSQKSEEYIIAPIEFNSKINSVNKAIILDVRTEKEFQAGHIKKAVNIDYNGSDFETRINQLDTNETFFVYCKSGGRSSSAVSYMKEQGFSNIFELKEGIDAWKKNKLPVE